MQNTPTGAPARGGVCWCALFARCTGWCGGGSLGASSPSSLIDLSGDEGNYFLESSKVKCEKLTKITCRSGSGIFNQHFVLKRFVRFARRTEVVYYYILFIIR